MRDAALRVGGRHQHRALRKFDFGLRDREIDSHEMVAAPERLRHARFGLDRETL
jgi:hypothetical protein